MKQSSYELLKKFTNKFSGSVAWRVKNIVKLLTCI